MKTSNLWGPPLTPQKRKVTIGPTHLLRDLLYLSSNSGNNCFPFPKWQLCFRGVGLLDLNNSPLVHNLRDSHNIPHPAMRFHYNPILFSDEDILRWCRTLDFFILKKDPSLTRGEGFWVMARTMTLSLKCSAAGNSRIGWKSLNVGTQILDQVEMKRFYFKQNVLFISVCKANGEPLPHNWGPLL